MTKISGIGTTETALPSVQYMEGERADGTSVKIPIALLTAARRIGGSATQIGTPASTTETDFHSFTVPAGTMASDGQALTCRFFGRYNSSTRNRTIRLYVAGVQMVSFSTANSGAFIWDAQIDIVRSDATHFSWVARCRHGSGSSDLGNFANVGNGATATWSGAVVIKATGQSAAGAVANDITGEGAYLEFLP